MSKRDQLCLDAALQLLKATNRVTTLEIKLKLREDHPEYNWTQELVSKLMQGFTAQGLFTFEDTGVFRIYSDPNITMTNLQTPDVQAAFGQAIAANAVATPALPVQQPSKVIKIGKKKAFELMSNAGGRFFTVTFKKKKGEERVLNGQYLSGQDPNVLGYVKVVELSKKKTTPHDCIRQVNLQTIKTLKIQGTLYKVAA